MAGGHDLNPAEMQALSDQLRAFYQTFDAPTQEYFKTVIQETFNIQNRRNVDLWLTTASTQRNFINRSSSPLELEMRTQFVKALTNGVPPGSPQKESRFTLWPQRTGQKLREYLANNYTRDNVTTIGFLNGTVIYTYDVYGEGVDEVPDESSDEFDDIFTE